MDRRTRIARRYLFALDAVWFAMLTTNLDSTIVGGIIRLMCHAWGDGTSRPTLSADDRELRRIAAVDALDEWARLANALVGELTAGADGRLYFVFQMAQWDAKQTLSSKRAKAGERGGSTKAARFERGRVLAVVNADEIDRAWIAIRERYPRSGDNHWKQAEQSYRALIRRGVDPVVLVTAVEHYAEFVHASGKTGTPWVKQARTFFGPDECWSDPWRDMTKAIASKPTPSTTIAARMRASRSGE